MSVAGGEFERLSTTPLASLRLVVEDYRHRVSGARHVHLACDERCEAFMVGLRAPAVDDSGVAHVLEHLTLAGSRRFPVSDCFFRLRRRSLAAVMNARTSAEGTHYHFASAHPRDFEMLLEVYLDAVFFPLLGELDFAREGCRLEWHQGVERDPVLQRHGVVYHEMQGAMASPARRLRQRLLTALLPGSASAFNPGGEPPRIAEMRHADLVAFHARHYRPGNALFLSCGARPAVRIQSMLQEHVLRHFGGTGPVSLPRVGQPPPSSRIETRIAGASAEDGEVVIGWRLDEDPLPSARLRASLLAGLLLEDADSALHGALAAAPRPASLPGGIQDDLHELVFACGVGGVSAARAERLEQQLMEALEACAERGFAPDRVRRAGAMLSLRARRLGGPRQPRSLALLLRALPALLHERDPVLELDVEAALQGLQHETAEPGWAAGRIRALLLDNPHRVRLTAVPDPELATSTRADEQRQLARLAASLDERARRAIEVQTRCLAEHQAETPAVDPLPRLRRSDLDDTAPDRSALPVGRTGTGAWLCRRSLDGVTRVLLALRPSTSAGWREEPALYRDLLLALGAGSLDGDGLRAAVVAHGAELEPRLTLGVAPADRTQVELVFQLSARVLRGEREALATRLGEWAADLRLDDHAALRRGLSRLRADRETRLTEQGHRLAMSAASATTGPAAALAEAGDGLAALSRLRDLERRLGDDEEALEPLLEGLARFRDTLCEASRDWLVVADDLDAGAPWLSRLTSSPAATRATPLRGDPQDDGPAVQGWHWPGAVAYSSMAWPAPPPGHRDVAALTVLGPLLGEGFLHEALRERGGAYGAGAGYDPQTASFAMFSYRDPRITGTLADFEHACEWVETAPAEAVEQAVLRAVAGLEPAGSADDEAVSGFLDALQGDDGTRRARLRASMLALDVADIARAARVWLTPAQARAVVIADRSALAAAGIDARDP